MNFVDKRNEEKIFVGTNDENLRNDLRNLGSVPIFFFKKQVLVMDTPSESFNDKMKLKEILKMEPTHYEKRFIKGQQDVIQKLREEEFEKELMMKRKQDKELYCMGIKTKLAKGPNPLSMRKK